MRTKLQRLMERGGYTPQELTRLTGYSLCAVYLHMRKGIHTPATAKRYARALYCTVPEILDSGKRDRELRRAFKND